MIHLTQAVVVEGRYDKIKLQSLLDATIIETNGFRIFKDKEKVALLRELAARVGIVVLTDSDTAGFRIRGYLKGCIRTGTVYQAYIPEILGKERRKEKPSAEGTLGVEGMPSEVILEALRRAGIADADEAPQGERIDKADLYEDGLTGGANSHIRRTQLLAELGLPRYLSANAMLDVLRTLYTRVEYKRLVEDLRRRENGGTL